LEGNRFIPSEIPSRLLLTGPNIISSKRNVGIVASVYPGTKLAIFAEYPMRLLRLRQLADPRNDRQFYHVCINPKTNYSYFYGHCEPDGSRAEALAKA